MRFSEIVIFLFLFSPFNLFAQKVNYEYPDSSDTKLYLDILYGNNYSLNGPFNTIKLDYADTSLFLAINKSQFHTYCKKKYKLTDLEVNIKARHILESNQKIFLADTVYLEDFRKFSYPIAILEKFRKYELIDFLNLYIHDPVGLNLYLEAYLFEKRLLCEYNGYKVISNVSLSQLDEKAGIYWNAQKSLWMKRNHLIESISSKEKKARFNSYPDKEDSEYFYSILTQGDPDPFSFIKLNFAQGVNKYFLITSLYPIKQYFEWKFNRKYSGDKPDQERLIKLISVSNPIGDTIFFSKNEFLGHPVYKVYNDSVLLPYRDLGIRSVFLDMINNNHCFCNRWPDKLLGYLFEKKILVDYKINDRILSYLQKKYKFKWNVETYSWENL